MGKDTKKRLNEQVVEQWFICNHAAFTLPFKNNRIEKVKVRRPSYSSYDGRRTMCMTAVARRVRQPPHHEKTAKKMATKALKILNKTLRNSDCLDVIKNFMCLSQSRLSISIT